MRARACQSILIWSVYGNLLGKIPTCGRLRWSGQVCATCRHSTAIGLSNRLFTRTVQMARQVDERISHLPAKSLYDLPQHACKEAQKEK